MTDPSARPTRAEQRRQTEARILAAAREMFAELGYDRTTIRAVATAAGVDAGLVMHYFGTKDELFARAAKLPADEMVHALQSAGFEGVYLDRYGYEDSGARMEKNLTRLLGRPLLVSPNTRWCFFKLSSYEPPADAAIAFRSH